jgi:hypothetical protein
MGTGCVESTGKSVSRMVAGPVQSMGFASVSRFQIITCTLHQISLGRSRQGE